MKKSKDFLVGLVFFGLLLLLGVFTVFLADFSFGEKPTVRVVFPDVAGLEPGADVRIDGVRSGEVKRVERRKKEGDVVVTLEFDGPPVLFKDATFSVASSSLLGGRVVEVESGTPDEPLPKREIYAGSATVADPLAGAQDVLAKVSAVIDENRADLRGTIQSIRSLAQALDSTGEGGLRDTLTKLNAITRRLEAGEGTLGALLTDPGLRDNLVNTAGNLEKLSNDLASGEGLLGSLASDSELRRDFEAAVGNLTRVSERLAAGEGTLMKLVEDPTLYDETLATVRSVKGAVGGISAEGLGSAIAAIQRAAENIEQATARLGRDDNTLGMLLTDEEMANKLRRSVSSLNELLEGQRENAPLSTFAGILLSPF